MKEIILNIDEIIKISGQRDTFVIVENINGDIFIKTGFNREDE